MTQNVSIIGYGTAGVNAIIGLRNAGYEGVIRAFSNTAIPPYSPILTSYYAGGEKTYEQCFPWSAAELEALDIEVFENHEVIELDVDAHIIRTNQGDYEYTKCIIATGALPSLAGFPETEYEPLVLRTMNDAERLKTALESFDCRRVLVSGASMVALKMLEACLKRGKQTTLVGISEHILDLNALPVAAERFEAGLRSQGVNLRLGQSISAVEYSQECGPGRLKVTFSTGEVDFFDEIAVAHGVRSNLGFLPEGALSLDRALLVDEFMRTNNADVYAAGDVVQSTELVTGEPHVIGIWKTAAVQGAVAGAAIAAELAGAAPSAEIAYQGALFENTITVGGMLFISAGMVAITENRRMEIRETEDMTVVYIYEAVKDGTERLVGFNVVSDSDVAGSKAYDTGAMLTLRIQAGCK